MATQINKTTQVQYTIIRQKLQELGYHDVLSNESSELVAKLLNDLLRYKNEATKAAKTNQQLSEECLRLKQQNNSQATELENVSRKCDFLEQTGLKNQEDSFKKIQELKAEILELTEKVTDLKFALGNQNVLIQKYKNEAQERSNKIIQLQSNGLENTLNGEAISKSARPFMERNGDLEDSNLTKIQTLYKRILSAAEDPAVVDWVQAAESKIELTEKEIQKLKNLLRTTEQTCDEQRKQILNLEARLTEMSSKRPDSLSSSAISRMRLQIDQLQRENKELNEKLKEAINRQHEAMSRAIMLSSTTRSAQQTNARENPPKKPSLVEEATKKRLITAETERDTYRELLSSCQKEKEELLKQIHQLHVQESELMAEIHKLVQQSTTTTSKCKTVHFQESSDSLPNRSKAASSTRDSGVPESSASDSSASGSSGYLRRLAEQRQTYYNSVSQLLDVMRSRTNLQQQQQVQQQRQQQESSVVAPKAKVVISRYSQTEDESDSQKAATVTPGKVTAIPEYADPNQGNEDLSVQTYVKTLMDERKLLKEQNDALRKRLEQAEAEVRDSGSKMESSGDKIRQLEKRNVELNNELEKLREKLRATEKEFVQERSRLQQMRLEMEDADSNAVSTRKKLADKSAQLDAARLRATEMESHVTKLEAEIGSLQGQLRALQIQKTQSDLEHRRLLDELDACNARIGHLENQLTIKHQSVSLFQTNAQGLEKKLHDCERQILTLQSELESARKQNQRASVDLTGAQNDVEGLRRENERLVSTISKLRQESDSEKGETENLRREIQTYVGRVRQIEAILARKDEEKDKLLKQLQQMANETNSFEAEREQMERTIQANHQHAAGLQAEIVSLRKRVAELETLYGQQRSCTAHVEIQANDLIQKLATLERDLREAHDDKNRLENQLSGARDLQQRLEKQLERLRIEAAQYDGQNRMLELEITRLNDDVQVLEQRLSHERDSVRSLESMVTSLRQERVLKDTRQQQTQQELSMTQQRERHLEHELTQAQAELAELKQREEELRKVRQELLQEKFERERTRQELRRIQNLSRTPPSVNQTPPPPPMIVDQTGTTPSSPAKTGRDSVAARLSRANLNKINDSNN